MVCICPKCWFELFALNTLFLFLLLLSLLVMPLSYNSILSKFDYTFPTLRDITAGEHRLVNGINNNNIDINIKHGLYQVFVNPRNPMALVTYNNNALTGRCEFYNNMGFTQYQGTLINGKKNGFGIMCDQENESVYIGEFSNNKFQGHGTLFHKGNIVYSGSWKNGKPTVDELEAGIQDPQLDDLEEDFGAVVPVEIANVHSDPELSVVRNSVRDLIISDCVGKEFTEVNWDDYKRLYNLTIGSSCFINVAKFRLKSLPSLHRLQIGCNSFTLVYDHATLEECRSYSANRSFSIEDCPLLESIYIGVWSFADYGKFALAECDDLEEIKIGLVGDYSYNFCNSQLILHSRIETRL